MLLKKPLPVYRLELASEALAIWRQYSAQRPTLLLLSNDPMLQRVPDQGGNEVTQLTDPASRGNSLLPGNAPMLALATNRVDNEVMQLADKASREELQRFSDSGQSSPVFLPKMTLDIALRQGWFRQLAWAFPTLDASQPMSLEVISEQFEKSGIAGENELASLNVANQITKGVLRGVPMTMAALPNLGELTGPVLLHIDQSYFQGMYKNEIATPLLQVVTETLRALRGRKLQTLAVTFVNGNLDGRVSLEVRFLQEFVTKMLENPEMLEQPLPVNWQRQAQTLYLANFFKTEEIHELALAMNDEQPDSAWIKFSLYLSARELKEGSKALNFLAAAVSLDKIYALEYFSLSEIAYEKGRPDEAMRMLSLAAQAFPEDVRIKLNMARLAADMGETATALHLVERLQDAEWSLLYYPEMPEYLEGFAAFLKETKASAPQPAAASPSADPRRQRVLK